MNNRRGFTMIEIAMVMVIMGVMAAFALVKYQKTVTHNDLEKTANNIYIELRSLRSLAFKWDTLTITKLYPDSISTWIDTNGNNKCDWNDIYKVIRLTAPIAVGLPEDPPSSGPYGENLSSSGKSGDWADSLTVYADSRGEYCHGSVYIYSKKLPKITYCVGISNSMQSLEFYKWDGLWHKL